MEVALPVLRWETVMDFDLLWFFSVRIAQLGSSFLGKAGAELSPDG